MSKRRWWGWLGLSALLVALAGCSGGEGGELPEDSPMIALSPAALNFGETGASGTFQVRNIGSGTLTWTTSSNVSWLTATPAGGSGAATVTVTANRGVLPEGNHVGAIAVTSNGGTALLPVHVVMPAGSVVDEPELHLTPSALSLAVGVDESNLTLANTGTGTLTWSVTTSQPWLTVAPSSGTGNAALTVTADRTGLPSGDNTANVVITSNGGIVTVPVTVAVAAPTNPVLSVAPSSVNLGTSGTTASLTLGNSGGGTLTWSATATQPWLTVSPVSGSNGATLGLTADRTGLSVGTHTAQVLVTSNGGDLTVPVSLTVAPVSTDPVLSASPSAINFGSVDTTRTIQVQNVGAGTLNWTVTTDQAWLTAAPGSGSGDDTLTVTVDRTGLPVGGAAGNVTISSNGGNVTVPVSVTVPEAPALRVSPTTLDFGAGTVVLNFSIQNTGGGTLTWTATDDAAWLTVGSPSGVGSGQVFVTVARTGLPVGDYAASITVNSNGGNAVIAVTMSVSDTPQLRVTPSALDFGDSATTGAITLTNLGGGTMTWSAIDNASWITISPTNGTGPGTITVEVSRAGLSAGRYTGTVQVASNGGTATVTIAMNVGAAARSPWRRVSAALSRLVGGS